MKQRMSRREALTWMLGLSGTASAGLCGVGGLLAALLGRQMREARAVTPTPTLAPPTVTPTPPIIVPRSAWNARPIDHTAENESGIYAPDNPLGWRVYTEDLAMLYRTVAIHHSHPILRDTGTMREIQDLHMDFQKWADIAYHYGVHGNGTIYEGRDIKVRGAHVAGYNTGTIGVVLFGDFEIEQPSAQQLDALQKLLVWLTDKYRLSHLAGHFEFNPGTQCPGKNMKPLLDGLAQHAGLQRGTGGYIPPNQGQDQGSGGGT